MTAAFLGRGWAAPVAPDPVTHRLAFAAGEEKVRQSIRLILATAPGERQMRPTFGCGVHQLLFAANTEALHALVAQRIRSGLSTWEPRIDVLDVTVESPRDAPSVLLARISYRIRANNAAGNLVYPFYLTEGPGDRP
jgi:phage baseplate assembly protein W